MGLYEVPLSVVIVGFWDRDYVSQLPCVRYYVLLRSVLNILVRNVSTRGPMCFRCLSCYFYFVLLPLGPEKWLV